MRVKRKEGEQTEHILAHCMRGAPAHSAQAQETGDDGVQYRMCAPVFYLVRYVRPYTVHTKGDT